MQVQNTINPLEKKFRPLIDLGLYDSVEAQCSFLLAEKLTPIADIVSIFSIITEALFLKHEYRSCISALNTAFQHLGYSSAASNRITIDTEQLAALKAREAKCYFHLKEHSLAMKTLESIPTPLRSLDILMMLVKCYKANGLLRQASMVQLEVLKQQPFALEIIEDLIMLNVNPNEVLAALESPREKGSAEDITLSKSVANMLAIKRQLKYNESKQMFDKLLMQYPRCPFILRHRAECYALCSMGTANSTRVGEALSAYQQLLLADPTHTRNLDLLGYLLFEAGREAELNQLASQVMQLLDCGVGDAVRTEGWLLMAMLAALRGDNTRTLRFIGMTVAANPKYWLTYLFKGRYYYSQGQHEAAAVALMQANAASKSIAAYVLLVETHLLLRNTREANYIAREAIVTFGHSSTPLVLLGRVLMQGPSASKEKSAGTGSTVQKHSDALKCFDKALRLDSTDHQAALLRAEVLLENNLLTECIFALQLALRTGAGVETRVLLGKVQGLAGQYELAVQTLHLAVSLDLEDTTGALSELDRVEKKLKIDRNNRSHRTTAATIDREAPEVKETPPPSHQLVTSVMTAPQRLSTGQSSGADVSGTYRRSLDSTGVAFIHPGTGTDTPDMESGRQVTGRISFGGDDEDEGDWVDSDRGEWEALGDYADGRAEEEGSMSGDTEPEHDAEELSPGAFMDYEFESPNL